MKHHGVVRQQVHDHNTFSTHTALTSLRVPPLAPERKRTREAGVLRVVGVIAVQEECVGVRGGEEGRKGGGRRAEG